MNFLILDELKLKSESESHCLIALCKKLGNSQRRKKCLIAFMMQLQRCGAASTLPFHPYPDRQAFSRTSDQGHNLKMW